MSQMGDRRLLPFQGWRLGLFRAVVLFSLLVLVIRTGELQFGQREQFVQDAEENRLQLALIPAPRGQIYDRNMSPLAQNDPAYNVTVTPAQPGDVLYWDGERLRTVHGPAWRLLIIGAGQIARYLAQMAQALDYDITVCEPREAYRPAWDLPGTRLLATMPDDTLLAMEPDARCAVVALTHDPKLDDMVLLEALRSPAFYVGALGSRANNMRRRERLAQHFGMAADELARLHGPVGLPIGSRTPPEIALAILAEMTAVRNGVMPGPWGGLALPMPHA